MAVACGGSQSPTSPGQPASDGFITNGSIRLAYSLDLPAGTGPFPAVVAGHGSGRITRTHLLGFAREWTTRGFAVLRFDKRGVGESTGTFVGVGVADSPRSFPSSPATLSRPRASCARDPRSMRGGSDWRA